MAFDDTGLNLIIADDRPAAHEYLEQTHPEGFFDTIGATVQRIVIQNEATSGSSVTIGTGTKVFTLVAARQWLNGMPVYIVEDGAPSDNVMAGTLSADETAGAITVNVTSAKGAGTFTAWTIFAIFAVTTTVVTPVSLADGGFGADMSTLAGRTTGRGNVDVPWFVPVRDFDVQDPAATDAWGDGDFGHVAASGTVGAFIGHEEAIFERTTIGVFVFIDTASLRDGDHAYEGGYGLSGVDLNRRYYNSDQSQWVQKEKPPGLTHSGPLTGGSNTIAVTDESPRLLSFELSGVGAVLTLPATGDWGTTLPNIIVWSDDTNVKTVNVAAGGTINGLATLTFSGGFAFVTLIVDSTNGEYVTGGPFARLDAVNVFNIGSAADFVPGFSFTAMALQNDSVAGDSVILSLVPGSTGTAQLTFGHAGDELQGRIVYDNSDGRLDFRQNSVSRLALTDDLVEVFGTLDCSSPGDGIFESLENAAGLPYEQFAVGTHLVFPQASPPTGWTQDVSNTEAALRVVSGAGGGTGGTIALTPSAVSGGTAISIAQMPVHNHLPLSPFDDFIFQADSGSTGLTTENFGVDIGSQPTTANAGSGSAHDHGIGLKHLDVIDASKD